MESLTASQRSCVKKLREDCECEDLSIDTARTIAAIDARYSVSSTRVALTSMRKMYPTCDAFIQEVKKRYEVYRAIDKSQVPTQKQVDAHIDWDTVIAWRDASGQTLPILDRMLVGLYTHLEPQRLDYTPMRIVVRVPKSLEDGVNYLVMAKKSARFIFHAYKTAGSYGDRVMAAPPALFKLLTEYLGERRSGYLLQDISIPWTEARLGTNVRRIFQRAFDKDFGVNGLRHAFVTKINEGMPSLAHLEDAAKKMGHDVITHQTYRHISLESS